MGIITVVAWAWLVIWMTFYLGALYGSIGGRGRLDIPNTAFLSFMAAAGWLVFRYYPGCG